MSGEIKRGEIHHKTKERLLSVLLAEAREIKRSGGFMGDVEIKERFEKILDHYLKSWGSVMESDPFKK